MKLIITAGGTSEPIDNVRKITNKSSGRLGNIIAQEFAKHLGDDDKIYFVCPKDVLVITNHFFEVVRVSDVDSVYKALEELVPKCDAIIHSMAISDYKVDYVTTSHDIAECVAKEDAPTIRMCLESGSVYHYQRGEKISSYSDDLMIHLVKTPKIIEKIKQWNPAIKLVGFKLLSGVTDDELLAAAKGQKEKCGCDMVVANDIKNISADKHEAIILTDDDIYKVSTKEEIAEFLYTALKDVTA